MNSSVNCSGIIKCNIIRLHKTKHFAFIIWFYDSKDQIFKSRLQGGSGC